MIKSASTSVINESEEEVLTLEDRMHLSLNKFRKLVKYIILISIGVFVFSGYAFYEITTIDTFLKSLKFDFPNVDDNSIFYHVEQIQGSVAISIAIAVGVMVWLAVRGSKVVDELNDLQKQKIRQSYYLTFETSVPRGETPAERIFYMVNSVFPEVKQAKRKAEKRGEEFYQADEKIRDYVYSLTINTEEGLLLVKFLEKQTFDELKNIVKNTGKISEKTKVFRLICVGKNFDEIVQDSDFENKMNKLSRTFKLDLISDDDKGYSMVWID